MSVTATEAPTAPEHKVKPSAAEYVRSLSPEEKQAVFLGLLREALQTNGEGGVIPIDDERGLPFGYYVPPKVAQAISDNAWNEIPVSVREVLGRPVQDLDNCISADQMLAILSREADSPPR